MLTNLTFTHAEKMFKCQSMAPNVSATDPSRPARASKAMWMVEVDGVTRSAFPSGPDDTEENLKPRIIDWYDKGLG